MTANTPSQISESALTTQDFLTFGINDVAYIRTIMEDGAEKYAVHAADGTELAVIDHLGQAIATIQHNELEVASVH
ncbi:MAG TPA: hypothetical protein DFI00_07965 [Rhodospirillaceae bacterium]|nr:hypothetical protein [Alphaproteobacteria bacterium]OUT41448.1 MAG: hypothetical protein CBB62_03645 [Micavibrio sp. TMED2]HCI47216.1 hypothetical protein [Rhodospirillaceae bacterium]MAS47004.1 hypothetical protein [Alphaproteobacteria bacterium]MAX95098.1 hypothetical protein [Alphaproteobacteria bacterium]|tara:strand:- start:32066 stop:32293 length:228 start_codon:yes stop_codon:yes gene_type:complete